MKKWKLLNSKPIIDSPFLKVSLNDYDINGQVHKGYYHIDRTDYVIIIATNAKGEFLIEKNYRRGIDQFVYELPAGWIESNETPQEAAIREFLEETGYTGENAQLIAKIPAQASFMSMYAHIVSVEISSSGMPNRDSDETMEYSFFKREELIELLHSEESLDMSMVAALGLFLLK